MWWDFTSDVLENDNGKTIYEELEDRKPARMKEESEREKKPFGKVSLWCETARDLFVRGHKNLPRKFISVISLHNFENPLQFVIVT